MRSCDVCATEFTPRRKTQHLCSKACRGAWLRARQAPRGPRDAVCARCRQPIKTGAISLAAAMCEDCARPARECPTCGTTFRRVASRAAVYCSRACAAAISFVASGSPTGREHWNWKGGADQYRGPGWRAIRDRIRDRDDWHCRDCGRDRRGLKLDVHHLVPAAEWDRPGTANDDPNLVSLCPTCHATRHNGYSDRRDRQRIANAKWRASHGEQILARDRARRAERRAAAVRH